MYTCTHTSITNKSTCSLPLKFSDRRFYSDIIMDKNTYLKSNSEADTQMNCVSVLSAYFTTCMLCRCNLYLKINRDYLTFYCREQVSRYNYVTAVLCVADSYDT